MPNALRYIPDDQTVFELTSRTVNGMLAFPPTPEIIKEWNGILSKACEKWPAVRLHQINLQINHFHLLASVGGDDRVNVRGAWSSFVLAGTARLAQRQFGIKGRVWDQRYRAIPVLDDAAIRDRTRYIMAQAVAARYVARPRDWVGLHSADALCRGAELVGYLTTAASRKRARRLGVADSVTAEPRRLTLVPLPGHTNWSETKRRAWYCGIEREIVAEEKARQANNPRAYPSPARLRRARPTTTVPLQKTPAPKAHVGRGNRALYRAWVDAKRHFVALWREALARWVDGAPPRFPSGGWLPFLSCSRQLSKTQV